MKCGKAGNKEIPLYPGKIGVDERHEATVYSGILAAGGYFFNVKRFGILTGMHLVVVKEDRRIVRSRMCITY